MAEPHLHMQNLPSLPKPITGYSAESLTAIATQPVMKDVAEGRITFLVAFTFRDRSWRMWRLHNVSESDDGSGPSLKGYVGGMGSTTGEA